jgi:DNA primase
MLFGILAVMSDAIPDLVKLAANYVKLTESRRSFRAQCPFHNDSAQSLLISPEKNIFKCFGCGIEGGPAEFINAIESLHE